MEFSEFASLTPAALHAHLPHPIGIAIPFNGTRRWYMRTFDKAEQDTLSDDYLNQVFGRMREVMGMMFEDGIHTIYTPIIGHDLAERGESYMQFSNAAIAKLGNDEAMHWYHANGVQASSYGQTTLLFPEVQTILKNLAERTRSTQHFLRYGVFADRPLTDIIAHVARLHTELGTPPGEKDLLASYYDKHVIPVDIWIGSDQPTVYDVPMVIHGNTALYFLQFPTLYLDRLLWRRILYDYLFVRGDQESLYPENISLEHHISGLGIRKDGYWKPATS